MFYIRPTGGKLFFDGIRFLTAGESALNQQAASRFATAGIDIRRVIQQLLNRLANIRAIQQFAKTFPSTLDIPVERFAEKLFLIAKGSIKAGPV